MNSDCTFQYIPHSSTHSFSTLVLDYLNQKETLRLLFSFTPDDQGIEEAIQARKGFPVDRIALVETLKEQYAALPVQERVQQNIEALLDEQTFTVCTAHQPNLLTGYLYFFYKIIHAVKLSDHLNQLHPAHQFVPVYYIGSEDNDIDELSVFNFNNKKYHWKTVQTGAVGRMKLDDLKDLILLLIQDIGLNTSTAEKVKALIVDAYMMQADITSATRYFVHALLGCLGVVVLDADHPQLKRKFAPIIANELKFQTAHQVLAKSALVLKNEYSNQAYSRPVNLFYLKDNIRERISQEEDGTFKVLNTDMMMSLEELLTLAEAHPEYFSPNVILRGLYQETILPNVAFIGGGSEIAYWLQLQDLFKTYKVFYPTLILRQSILWKSSEALHLQQLLNFSEEQLFQPQDKLVHDYVLSHTEEELSLLFEKETLYKIMQGVKERALKIDETLSYSVGAAMRKMEYQLNIIEKKLLRKEKLNHQVGLERIKQLKNKLYPNGTLQERRINFLDYYLKYDQNFVNIIYKGTLPYGDEFLIINEKQE